MSPLQLFDFTLNDASYILGVFGATLAAPAPITSILDSAQTIATELDITLQVVDASRVAGPHHLLFATIHALRAFHHGTQRATTLGMEILRFAAAQRQIARALPVIGITDATRHLGGILLNASGDMLRKAHTQFLTRIDATDAFDVLEITGSDKAADIQAAYNIGAAELAATAISSGEADQFDALAKLVYDRCALLAIKQ